MTILDVVNRCLEGKTYRLTILDVVNGCLEGKTYRYPGMRENYVICKEADGCPNEDYLCVSSISGGHCWYFPASVKDVVRDNYFEVKTEEDLYK